MVPKMQPDFECGTGFRGQGYGPVRRRRGLSLLEVMLALGILGLSLAAIGEIMRIGSRNAEMARDLTTAQILCETKMAELAAGMLAPIPVTEAAILDVGTGDDWYYSIETQSIGQEGLLAVRVVVQQNPQLVSRPVSFSLIRWMIDPQQISSSTDTTGGATSTSTVQ
jgi:prepilin-type N-terminal cleavage/methylation domain-containing protein